MSEGIPKESEDAERFFMNTQKMKGAKKMISACGLMCNECTSYKTECEGCHRVTGKTFWADSFENKTCPLFDCAVNNHGLKNCSECGDLPCNKFKELKDPNITTEEHLKSINDRVNRLKQTQ